MKNKYTEMYTEYWSNGECFKFIWTSFIRIWIDVYEESFEYGIDWQPETFSMRDVMIAALRHSCSSQIQ